jgi:hypothetical protein
MADFIIERQVPENYSASFAIDLATDPRGPRVS